MIFLLKLLASLFLLGVAVWWINRGFRARRKISRLAAKSVKVFERDRQQLALSFNTMQQERRKEQPDGELPLIELGPESPVLASDLYAGELYALATSRLIATEESTDRAEGTAIYRWSEGKGGHWLPTDRLLLDVTPAEALKQYRKTLTKL